MASSSVLVSLSHSFEVSASSFRVFAPDGERDPYVTLMVGQAVVNFWERAALTRFAEAVAEAQTVFEAALARQAQVRLPVDTDVTR